MEEALLVAPAPDLAHFQFWLVWYISQLVSLTMFTLVVLNACDKTLNAIFLLSIIYQRGDDIDDWNISSWKTGVGLSITRGLFY